MSTSLLIEAEGVDRLVGGSRHRVYIWQSYGHEENFAALAPENQVPRSRSISYNQLGQGIRRSGRVWAAMGMRGIDLHNSSFVL